MGAMATNPLWLMRRQLVMRSHGATCSTKQFSSLTCDQVTEYFYSNDSLLTKVTMQQANLLIIFQLKTKTGAWNQYRSIRSPQFRTLLADKPDPPLQRRMFQLQDFLFRKAGIPNRTWAWVEWVEVWRRCHVSFEEAALWVPMLWLTAQLWWASGADGHIEPQKVDIYWVSEQRPPPWCLHLSEESHLTISWIKWLWNVLHAFRRTTWRLPGS